MESDSVNEHSPASRPSIRRKRKFKRMSIDEVPVPPNGKRKRSQRMDYANTMRSFRRMKPLHQSVVDKIEKFCQPPLVDEVCLKNSSKMSCTNFKGNFRIPKWKFKMITVKWLVRVA